MTRWEPDSRGRLHKAALSLYGEKGFEKTTVAEIAERAGLTERTFFRHFADKREVLFAGGEELERLVVEAIAGAPDDLGALDAVALGLDAAAAMLQDRADFAGQRQQIIAANADLQERERAKLASLGAAMAAVLRERGVEDPTASIAAEAGSAVFRVGFERWASGGCEGELAALMRDSLAQLRAVAAAG